MSPAASPEPPPLDMPTPGSANGARREGPVSVTDIDLDDSAEITEANMRLLLARAKAAGKDAARKTRMAFDTTKALTDSGMLKLPPRTRKHKQLKNGTG